MMKRLLFSAVMMLSALCSIHAAELYGELDEYGKLTIYYDDMSGSRSGTELSPSQWHETPYPEQIISCVIDPSVAVYKISYYDYFSFWGLENLTSIEGLENLNTSNMTDMSSMFWGCSSLTSLDLSSFDTSNVKDMGCMFEDCPSLTSLDLSSFDTSNVTCMYNMFNHCSSLTSLDLSSFNTSNVTDMHIMFSDCSNLTTIYVDETKWSTDNLDHSDNYMFAGCYNLVGGNGTDYSTNDWFSEGSGAEYARVDKPGQPGYLTDKFPPTLYGELNYDGKLTIYYDRNKDYRYNPTLTPKEWMDSYWDYDISSCVIDPSVADCEALDLKNFFAGKSSMQSIEGLENLNTSNVTDMSYMFSGCSSLTSLDLSNFDTSNVTNMSYMFSGCSSLTSLDLSNFDTSNVTDSYDYQWGYGGFTDMFRDCSSLETIYVDELKWNTVNVNYSYDIFYNCFNLVGGNGTTYESSKTDKEYARIDKSGQPGYLTDISTIGIKNIEQQKQGYKRYYTIDGKLQQGKPTKKGVYVTDGKKIVVE